MVLKQLLCYERMHTKEGQMVARFIRKSVSLLAFVCAGFGLASLIPYPDGSLMLPVWASVTMIAVGTPTFFLLDLASD